MGWHFSLFLALIACGGKPEFPQSQPITETPELPKDSISVPMGSDAEKPTAVDLLTLRLPALQQLQQSEMEAVVASLNLVPSPCSMCPNRTVAHCLVDLGWTECRVLGKLANRAIRLAKDGQGVDQIKIAANYPDTWFLGMGEGKPVQIHLYRDLDGSFARQTEEIRSRIVEIFGDQVSIITHDDKQENVERLGIRSRPAWFVNGHRFRGVQSVNGIARFVSYELAD